MHEADCVYDMHSILYLKTLTYDRYFPDEGLLFVLLVCFHHGRVLVTFLRHHVLANSRLEVWFQQDGPQLVYSALPLDERAESLPY